VGMSTTTQPTTTEHDCTDHLMRRGADPALPPFITPLECRLCGRWFNRDETTGKLEVDR